MEKSLGMFDLSGKPPQMASPSMQPVPMSSTQKPTVPKPYKPQLLEFLQKAPNVDMQAVSFQVERITEPPHEPNFKCILRLPALVGTSIAHMGEQVFEGQARSKKAAEHGAAKMALRFYEDKGLIPKMAQPAVQQHVAQQQVSYDHHYHSHYVQPGYYPPQVLPGSQVTGEVPVASTQQHSSPYAPPAHSANGGIQMQMGGPPVQLVYPHGIPSGQIGQPMQAVYPQQGSHSLQAIQVQPPHPSQGTHSAQGIQPVQSITIQGVQGQGVPGSVQAEQIMPQSAPSLAGWAASHAGSPRHPTGSEMHQGDLGEINLPALRDQLSCELTQLQKSRGNDSEFFPPGNEDTWDRDEVIDCLKQANKRINDVQVENLRLKTSVLQIQLKALDIVDSRFRILRKQEIEGVHLDMEPPKSP